MALQWVFTVLIERHVELRGNVALRHLGREVSQHGSFSFCQLLDQCFRRGRAPVTDAVPGLDASQVAAGDPRVGAPIHHRPGFGEEAFPGCVAEIGEYVAAHGEDVGQGEANPSSSAVSSAVMAPALLPPPSNSLITW